MTSVVMTGWSMKRREMFMRLRRSPDSWPRFGGIDVDADARHDAQLAVDDHSVARLHVAVDRSRRAVVVQHLDRTLVGPVVGGDDVRVLALGTRVDRLARYDRRAGDSAELDRDADELARHERGVGVRERRAQLDRSARVVDVIADESTGAEYCRPPSSRWSMYIMRPPAWAMLTFSTVLLRETNCDFIFSLIVTSRSSTLVLTKRECRPNCGQNLAFLPCLITPKDNIVRVYNYVGRAEFPSAMISH